MIVIESIDNRHKARASGTLPVTSPEIVPCEGFPIQIDIYSSAKADTFGIGVLAPTSKTMT
jgi:hypothetical protein